MHNAPNEITRRRRQSGGFTLIEIIAVVMIIGLLTTLVGVNIVSQINGARVNAARAQIAQIENTLEMYNIDSGRYPSTTQGLDALVDKPSGDPVPRNYPRGGYITNPNLLQDPWGNDYHYENPGTRNTYGFDLWSYGADGAAGGSDIDAEIGNWKTADKED
jgi:general secretion pathway protein G